MSQPLPSRLLEQSPLDRQLVAMEPAPQARPTTRWVPSRYNVRAHAEDGSLILWNTLLGAMSVFKPAQVPLITELLSRRKHLEGEPTGLVKYLVDRGFLIQEGVDEFRQFQFFFGQSHYRQDTLGLILLASEDCNFRCKYCYEKFARGTMQPQVRQGVKRLIEKRLPQLQSLHVSWFGGEPLYGWVAIEELSTGLLALSEEHGFNFSGSMTTNGYLLTPERAEQLLAWKVRHFQITLDGAPEQHDCSRPARDGSPTFARIFENVLSLSRQDTEFGVTIRVNFDQKNHPHLESLMNLLQKELCHDSRFRLNFHAVGRWGGDNDNLLEVCATDSFEIGARLRAAAHDRGLRVGTLREANLPGAGVCYAALPHNFIIGASGKIMKCTVALDADERNVVGQLTPEGEMVLNADKLALWTEPAFEGDKQCRQCVMLPNCQGLSCPLVRMEQHRSPCPPTRRHFKRQLIESMKFHKAGSRLREVPFITR